MWGGKLYWVISFVSNVKVNDAKRKEYKWTTEGWGHPFYHHWPPCLVTICLGVLSIVLGVCLKWAILPPVVDSMVMSQLRWQNIVKISRNFVDSSSYTGWRRATLTRGRPGWRRPSRHTWSSTSSRYRSSPHPCPWCYITKIEFAKLFHRRVASWWSKEFSIKILFLWLRHNERRRVAVHTVRQMLFIKQTMPKTNLKGWSSSIFLVNRYTADFFTNKTEVSEWTIKFYVL